MEDLGVVPYLFVFSSPVVTCYPRLGGPSTFRPSGFAMVQAESLGYNLPFVYFFGTNQTYPDFGVRTMFTDFTGDGVGYSNSTRCFAQKMILTP